MLSSLNIATQPTTSQILTSAISTMTTTDTITLMAPSLALITTKKLPLTLRARKETRSRSKSRNMLPKINVTMANELFGKTPSAVTGPLQAGHLSPHIMSNYSFPMASVSTVTSRQLARFITPPSIPVLRINGPRPVSSSRISRETTAPHRSHRRAVSLPIHMMGPPRPLTDGPMGYTYTPVASRSSESLDFFLPPEHYVRHNTANISLGVSICGPAERQVIACTPGAAHAMGVETKKKGRIMKGARTLWRFFRR